MELKAKKSLGQHFLKSEKALSEIMKAANIKPGETVLEIGPGTGILTERLLRNGADVIAVEKDDAAFGLLQNKFGSEDPAFALARPTLIHSDILKFENPLKDGEYAIVANIPYYITGAILELFLEHPPRPNRMVLLIQKEVADRIVAKPAEGKTGGKLGGKESVLSIAVKAFGEPRIVSKVPRGAFVPPPDVDSAVISIENISDKRFRQDKTATSSTAAEITDFFKIVKAGFAHKRKFLVRNLEDVASRENIEKAWKASGLNEKTRAEDLKIEDWINIAREIRR